MRLPWLCSCCSILLLLCSTLRIDVSASSTKKTSPSFWRRHHEKRRPLSSWFSFQRTIDDDDHRHPLLPNTTSSNATLPPTTTKQKDIPAWKRSLPEPLCSRATLERILVPFRLSTTETSNDDDDEGPCFVQVYLLGTAHVSTDSCQDVCMLLEHVDPDVLFLELCEQRMGMLFAATSPNISHDSRKDMSSQQQKDDKTSPEASTNLTFWQKVHLLEQDPTKAMSRPAAMATVLLTQVQEEYANSLGVELGGEFRVAYQYYVTRLEQEKQQQQQLLHDDHTFSSRRLHVILGDRPLFLTLRRSWQSLNSWGRTRLLAALIWSSVWPVNPEEIKAWMQAILESGATDIVTQSIAKLNQTFPTLVTTILDERNAYMACKLYQTCRFMIMRAKHDAMRSQQQPSRNNIHNKRNITIVAVVGAGHVPGMVEWFTNGNEQSPEQVLRDLVLTKSKIDPNYNSPLTEEERNLIENVIELQLL